MGPAVPQPLPEPLPTLALRARVAALAAAADTMAARAIVDELEALRRIAAAQGILPAVTVIHAIDSALARGERGALVHAWLDILGDAMACGRADAQAHDAYAAACSVRLAGG